MSNVSLALSLVLPTEDIKMSPHFQDPEPSCSETAEVHCRKMKGWAELHPWRKCFIPKVNTLWKSSCTARLAALSKAKAETSMSLLGPGSQRKEQKRFSRAPSPTEGDRDVLQVVPACLGEGSSSSLSASHSSQAITAAAPLLTLPPFPT